MQIGMVAIGRNEGDRLKTCLAAASAHRDLALVYVDSGSTDGSSDVARSFGTEVVDLDLSIPFTAARARNEGFARLLQMNPDVQFVQFLDGDCELRPDWITKALAHFEANPKSAVVCGRRRERYPDATIYNMLCDQEWNTPVGKARSCGGDALMRVSAFREVNGYDPSVIAGEEPEMCVRLRSRGWEIWRIDAEMTLHDAAMTRFSQWWKRNLRTGYAYSEGVLMHGAPPENHLVKESRSNWIWGLILPLLGVFTLGLLWLIYPLQWFRVYRKNKSKSGEKAVKYAFFIVLGKFPQMFGQLKFHWNRWTGRKSKIIEYKGAAVAEGQTA